MTSVVQKIRNATCACYKAVGHDLPAGDCEVLPWVAPRHGWHKALPIILLLGFAAVMALSPLDLAWADQGLSLRLVTGPDYKPYTDPAMPQGGMHGEIVRAAFAKVGDQVDITFEPWARGYADAQHLAFDGTFPYVRSAEREKDFLYSDVIYVLLGRAYMMADNPMTGTTVDDLGGKALCLPNGYVVPEKVQAMIDAKSIKLERALGMEQCFKLMQVRRVDFVICSDIQARATSLRLWGKDDAVKSLPFVIAQSTHSLIVSRRHPNAERIIADFNHGLALLKASGELDAIIKRQLDDYFGHITD